MGKQKNRWALKEARDAALERVKLRQELGTSPEDRFAILNRPKPTEVTKPGINGPHNYHQEEDHNGRQYDQEQHQEPAHQLGELDAGHEPTEPTNGRKRPGNRKGEGGGSSPLRGSSEEKRRKFLAELERIPVVGHAAKVARTSTGSISRWRRDDKEFDKAVKAALEVGIDRLEAETISQALQQAEKGNPTHLLKMFVLKSKRRDVYGERLEVNQTHRHEIVVDLVPASITAGADGQLHDGRPQPLPVTIDAHALPVDTDGRDDG